jgi:hypothetical protein
LFISCNKAIDPIKIIQNTISSIDTINTIYYQQTQLRGNTENIENVKQKERTFYYGRLKFDSIIGAKAHFIDNPDNVYFTDNTFYNIKFNPELNDSLFITSDEVITGFEINEIKP